MKQPARNGQICRVRGFPREQIREEGVFQQLEFHRVCARSPNSQVPHREVWDHHCKPAAWGKMVGKQSIAKNPTQNLRTNPFVIASPWRNHFREIHINYWCPTNSGTEPPSSTLFFHAESAMLILFSLGYCTQLMAVKKSGICKKNISRKWNYIARIYDENLSRERTLQDITLKTFPPSLLFSKDLCLCCRNSKML